MFDRNEWLKWAESAKNNNPSMREFRRSYRNIQEESNPVDEDVTESLKDILAGAKNVLRPKGSRFFYIKEPGKEIKKPFKSTKEFLKKAVKNSDSPERTRINDVAKTAASAATQAYLWSKVGGPSKKEKEEMERQSSTRLGTQQPQEESVQLDEGKTEFAVAGVASGMFIKAFPTEKIARQYIKNTYSQKKKLRGKLGIIKVPLGADTVSNQMKRFGKIKVVKESVELDEIRRARPKTKQIDATLLAKMKKVQTQTKDKSGTMQGLMTPEQKGTKPGELSASVEYRLAELGYQLDEAAFLAAIPALLSSLGSAAAGAGSAIAGAAGTAASAAGGALASGGAMAGRAALGAGKLAMRAGGGIKKGLVGPKSIIGKHMAKKKSFIGPPKPKAGIKKFIPGKESLKSAGKDAAVQGSVMAPMMMGRGGGGKPNTTVQSSAPPSPPPATGAGSESNARQRARQQLATSYEPEGTELNEFIGRFLKGFAKRRKAPLPKAPFPKGTASMLPAKPGGTPLVTNNPKLLNAPGHKTSYFDAPKSAAGAVQGPNPNAPSARRFVQKQKQGRIDLDKMKTTNAPYATGSTTHTQAKTALQPKLANLKTQLQQKRSQGVVAGKQGSLALSPASGAKISTAPIPKPAPNLKVLPPPKLTLKQKIKQGAKKAFAPGTKDTQAGVGRRVAGTLGSAATTAYMFNKMTPQQKADTTVQSTRQLAASVGRISSKYAQQLDESRMSEIRAMSQEGKTHEEIGKKMDIHPSVIKKVLQQGPTTVVRKTRLLQNPMTPIKIK